MWTQFFWRKIMILLPANQRLQQHYYVYHVSFFSPDSFFASQERFMPPRNIGRIGRILLRQGFHLRATCYGGQAGGCIGRIGNSRKTSASCRMSHFPKIRPLRYQATPASLAYAWAIYASCS